MGSKSKTPLKKKEDKPAKTEPVPQKEEAEEEVEFSEEEDASDDSEDEYVGIWEFHPESGLFEREILTCLGRGQNRKRAHGMVQRRETHGVLGQRDKSRKNRRQR